MKNKTTIYIKGMHCPSCEILVEGKINKIEGIKKVKANQKTKTVDIAGNIKMETLLEESNNLLNTYGYTLSAENTNETKKYKQLLPAFLITSTLIMLFIILENFKVLNFFNVTTMNYPAIFLMGFVASLSSCAAVVGGLILSLGANLAKKGLYTNKTIWAFHLSRLIGFFMLGGIIGFIGKSVAITPHISIGLNLLIGLVMLILGINLLNIFDFTKKLQVTMPKIISKKFITKSNNNSIFSSIFLGLSTFFLPCGFTQSMQLFALSSRNFIEAAFIMLTFALGTLPVLLLITYSSKTFSTGKYSDLFFKTAGLLVIAFGAFNLYNATVVAQIIK